MPLLILSTQERLRNVRICFILNINKELASYFEEKFLLLCHVINVLVYTIIHILTQSPLAPQERRRMLNGQLSPIAHTDRFNILCRANSFLNSHNLSLISEKAQQFCAKTDIFASFFEVAPISISHLDRLYFHTIYSVSRVIKKSY